MTIEDIRRREPTRLGKSDWGPGAEKRLSVWYSVLLSPKERDTLLARIDELEAEHKKLALKSRVLDRLPLCPDHRDKVWGRPCLECENARLREALERVQAEVENVREEESCVESFLFEIESIVTQALERESDAILPM